jgi:hypothetical protein
VEVKLKVLKITENSLWLFSPVNACTQSDFDSHPDTLEVGGATFRKRSFAFDGVNYVCGQDPEFVGCEPLIKRVETFVTSVFTTSTPNTVPDRVIQEAGELKEACALWPPKYEEYTKHGKSSAVEVRESIGHEIADVYFCLVHLAVLCGVNFYDCVRSKLDINLERSWSEPDENNQRRHI